MKVWLIAAALPSALFPVAAGATVLAQQTCAKGADVRVVEVISPGEVGAACDLRYTREAGANISVPFNAQNSTAFCGIRARDLVTSLTAAGYACSNPGAFDKIAAMKQAVDLDAMLAGGPSADPARAAAPAPSTESATLEPVSATATGANALAQPPASAELSVPAPLAQIPAAPPAHATATGAPVPLTTAATPLEATRARYSVGRLVGASPEDARLSTLAAIDDDAQSADDRLAPPAPASSDGDSASGRPPLDAVVATVQAQAAAWNDGDLDGFMNGFWNDPEFTFITGTTVTKGWKETFKRYRDGYGEKGDLGRLVYSNLEARLLAPETASVVGRYAFQRGEASSAGTMTLVVRRFEGAWRVVQHQMTADAPAPQTAASAEAPAEAASPPVAPPASPQR